tara:strand:+ start:64695 stop:64862 length:168 start_codon:yes stop_codon:yes gene_type:complete
MPAEEKKDEVEKAETVETVETKNETNEELDFAEMDLTVEAVEERISPSETNVFDK